MSVARSPASSPLARSSNGRLSLTEAEGVAATIAARSDAELRAAGQLRRGSLGRLGSAFADELADALARVEAGIDFTDQEDVVAIEPRELQMRVERIRSRIGQLLERAVGMEQLEAIPWVVVVGPPNAGKSSLFNALLGHERAVVSAAAGTTRDVIVEPLHVPTDLGSAEVMLVDLAGTADCEDALGRAMQSAARAAVERADLVVRCTPAGAAIPPTRPEELLVSTKSDLRPTAHVTGAVMVSSITGSGLGDLKTAIGRRLQDRAVSLAADATALLPRHEASLRAAKSDLDEALRLLEASSERRTVSDPELVAACLRSGLDELGDLIGRQTPDDVLGRVFASFCIGK